MPDKLPPHIRAQIEDFKRKATHNEALSKEYRDQYSKVHTPNQPTYEQWLKENGKQRMAKGGEPNIPEWELHREEQLQLPVNFTATNAHQRDEHIPQNATHTPTKHMMMGRLGHNIDTGYGTINLGATGMSGNGMRKLSAVDIGYQHPSGAYARVEHPTGGNGSPRYEVGFRHHFAKGGKAAYLKDSKVKNRVYHGTYDDFATPKTNHGDDEYYKFGIHVGTADQANKRIKDISGPGNFSRTVDKAPSVMPLHIHTKNPLRLDENRSGRWGVNDILSTMMEKADQGHIRSIPKEHVDDYFNDEFNMDKALGKKSNRLWANDYEWNPGEKSKALKAYLHKLGHDSIVYKNEHEGEGDSHILFHPHQLKSAIGNRGTYDPNEHDITKAKGGDVSIQDMRNYILQREGTHGAKRLERAADEIPNLEKMYSPEALKEAFSGDNTRVVATIHPKDFERYAMPLPMNLAVNKAYHSDKAVKPTMRQAFMDSGLTDQQWQELNDYQRADLFDKYNAKISKMKSNRPMSYDQYIKHLAKIKGGFAQVPFLQLDKQEQGLPIVPHITGHEGRHRNRALFHKGVEKSLVTLEPRAELREGFPRRERGEYLDALKKEMAMTNNMVRPEDEEEYGKSQIIRHRRSPIQLPDFYAEGGDVQGKPMNTPTLAQMRHSINTHGNPEIMDNIGINEAMDMDPKIFVSPNPHDQGVPAVGGVADSHGLPIGGVDINDTQPGQQLNPQDPSQQQQPGQAPQPGQAQAPGGAPQGTPTGPTPPQGNMLSLTPQGQTMNAMAPNPQGQQPQGLAEGGQPKRMFKIQTAGHQEKRKEPEFTPYEAKDISIKKLARAFDEAIAHHRSLPNEERIMNSFNAAQKLGKIIGVNPNGMTKDLLGKNAKLLKTEQGKVEELKLPDNRGVETTGLALAPAYEEEGFTTCPNSASCKKECLGKTSGNYHKLGGGADLSEFKGPRLNSLKKTQAFLHDPHSFAVRLHDEIQAAKEMAGANNNHLGVRLNVLSDINPRVHKAIIEAHPDVTFYDYTKNNTNPIAPNHHYTYSSTGVSQHGVENPNTNWKQMRKRLTGGDNVAMAFSHKAHIPEYVHDEETGHKFKVINGDTHDFRPMDMQPEGQHGVIVGLKNKKATGRMNEAHIDSQGFFVHHDPQEKVVLNKSGKPIYARDAKGKTIAQNKEVRIKPQYEEMKLATNDDGDKV